LMRKSSRTGHAIRCREVRQVLINSHNVEHALLRATSPLLATFRGLGNCAGKSARVARRSACSTSVRYWLDNEDSVNSKSGWLLNG
jgi:hypothetical protein